MPADDIDPISGKTNPNILLIAPHGRPEDDTNTGDLVRSIQKILDCSAIINEVFRKPKLLKKKPKKVYEDYSLENRILNLNYRPEAEQYPYYIEQIQQRIKDPTSTFVFWIHGIDDENLKDESARLSKGKTYQCLIGLGQGKPNKFSCDPDFAVKIGTAMNSVGISTDLTDQDSDNYRGHHHNNMNQWFKESGNGLKAVQSIQLEFGMKGIRDPGSIEKTAKKFADALISLNGAMNVFPVEDNRPRKHHWWLIHGQT